MLNDLRELIAVKSVMGEAKENAPFGEGPRKALDVFLNIAARYGFKTHDEGGYCGWAGMGEGEDIIGILGHLDVVPAGEGWSHDPYSLAIEDGLLLGRGVADDKGPTIAALHAMKRIKDSGIKLRHRVRLIVGCNEENGSQCIEYYREHCEIPKASFVPDADFPIINSEKGILHLLLTLDCDSALTQNVSKMNAGIRPNVVPDLCSLDVPKDSELYGYLEKLGSDNSVFTRPEVATVIARGNMRIEDFSIHFFEDKLVLEARGVAGHAMDPDKGENAAVKMLKLLSGLPATKKSAALNSIVGALGANDSAKLLGIECEDEVSGKLTVNLGILELKSGKLNITLDLRLPVCADHEKVKAKIAERISGAVVAELRFSPNLYIPADNPLITARLSAYEEVTGEKGECLYCGGGTYARELPNAVAFGPTFKGLETNIHNIDESFPIELMEKLVGIYEKAILKLDLLF